MAFEARPEQELPRYEARQFADPPADCDMIMKGGVTSGIVYPYAVLEIATKYRLRSLGGTSAGAIAAAFAAAAEFARRRGDLEGFVRLQRHCDELPGLLPSLFQADRELKPTVERLRRTIGRGGLAEVVRRLAARAAVVAVVFAGLAWLYSGDWLPTVLAAALFGLLAFAGAAYLSYVRPLLKAWRDLPAKGFGICSGLSSDKDGPPALTEWMHRAIQDIAFGDPDHPHPLTFGDLEAAPEGEKPIRLSVVTTNLSMRRPHTLPALGAASGYDPERWRQLFPAPVMDYLAKATRPWSRYKGTMLFPKPEALPVLVAVRMSLSFPLLFSSVELYMEDFELPTMLKGLGAEKIYKRIRRVTFSDGGLSSNFPIHLFDAPLPGRPTFAISLEELLWNPAEVARRVTIPKDAGQGMGVRIKELKSVPQFGMQVIDSAKDWQDQLLSELTGQRERIARIYLTPDEGGLNLEMHPEVSRQLMLYGLEAGREFCDGAFDFDEHRWRRLIVLYDHLDRMLSRLDEIWTPAYREWFEGYRGKVRSYAKAIPAGDREKILRAMDALVAAHRNMPDDIAIPIERRDTNFPKKRGKLAIGPTY